MQLEPVPHDGASEHLEDSELETQFFSTPPSPLRDFDADSDLPSQPPPIPRTNQLVMVATLAMLATAALVIPLTLVYSKSLGGANGMLSHQGPFLPDSATYRQAIEAIEEPAVATDVLAATVSTEAPEPVPASTPTAPATDSASATVPPPGAEATAEGPVPASMEPVTVTVAAAPTAPVDEAIPPAESAASATIGAPSAAQQQISAPRATADSSKPIDAARAGAKGPAAAKPRARKRRGGLDAAFKLFNAGKFKAAERAARRAANRNPTRADAWLLLGAARDAQGNRAGAIAAYHVCSARAKGPAAMDCMRLAGGH